MEKIINDYEAAQLEQRIFPLVPTQLHTEMKYLIENQFENRAVDNDGTIVRNVLQEDMNTKYNINEKRGVDGILVKACDDFAAYIEASISIMHGIQSHHLVDARKNLLEKYKSFEIYGINFGQLYDYFA
ncbi:MAG: hypothetical protein AB1454_15030 [Candidatus Auribacterota bacterium]